MLKGRSSLKMISALVLGVMFVVVGIQAVNNINTESIQGNTNTLNEAVKSVSQVVKIGHYPDSDPKPVNNEGRKSDEALAAEKEFRALAVTNMLFAVRCDIGLAITNGERGKADGAFDTSKLNVAPDFDALYKRTDYSGYCAGANAIDLNKFDDYYSTVNPLDADNQGALDTEGRQGRINFEIHQNFTTGELHPRTKGEHGPDEFDHQLTDDDGNKLSGQDNQGGAGDVLLDMDQSLKAYYDDNSWLGGQIIEGNTPEYFKGKRAVSFLPSGFASSQSNPSPLRNIYDHEVRGPSGGWVDDPENSDQEGKWSGEGVYLGRVRMDNDIPLIIDNGWNPRGMGTHEFFKNVRYKLCEGMEGYIQSNAGDIANGGESTSDNAGRENGVFPAVEITEKSDYKCIKSVDEIETSQDFGWWGYRLDGTQCSTDTNDPEHDNFDPSSPDGTKEIGGATVGFECGYKRILLTDSDFGNEYWRTNTAENGKVNPLPVYTAGWYAKCSDMDHLENLIGNILNSGYIDKDEEHGGVEVRKNELRRSVTNYEIISSDPGNQGSGSLIFFDGAKGDGLEWEVSKSLEFWVGNYDISDNDNPGELNIYAETFGGDSDLIAEIDWKTWKIEIMGNHDYGSSDSPVKTIGEGSDAFNAKLEDDYDGDEQYSPGEYQIKINNDDEIVIDTNNVRDTDGFESYNTQVKIDLPDDISFPQEETGSFDQDSIEEIQLAFEDTQGGESQTNVWTVDKAEINYDESAGAVVSGC